MAAFEAGLSPEIVHVEPGITVLRFIEGRTFGEADLRANSRRIVPLSRPAIARSAAALRGPANVFWVFHVIRDYVRLLDADATATSRWPTGSSRRQVPLPIVFGHHDLLPGNFMDDGKRLWLIDWEYGGFGTAMFDLANLVVQRRVRRGRRTRPCSMPISRARSTTICAAPSPP